MIKTIVGFEEENNKVKTPIKEKLVIPTNYTMSTESKLKPIHKFRKGDTIVIKGHPCKLLDILTCK